MFDPSAIDTTATHSWLDNLEPGDLLKVSSEFVNIQPVYYLVIDVVARNDMGVCCNLLLLEDNNCREVKEFLHHFSASFLMLC